MVTSKSLKQVLGSFVNIFNSGLNFGIYIFLPILVGIHSYTAFQLENVKPSFIILLFSPSLPYIVYKEKNAFFTFALVFVAVSSIIFFFADAMLLFANMLWLLYGLIAMILYYNEQKNKFYLYTVLLTCCQILTLFVFKDYYTSYVTTAFVCFVLILIKEFAGVRTYYKGMPVMFSWNIANSMLRPIFSIGFFWQVMLYLQSHYGEASFLSLTYYSKISMSTTVAVFSVIAMDVLKENKIDLKVFFLLVFLSVFGVNVLIYALDFFGKNTVKISHLASTFFLILSIAPSLLFNIVSDDKIYRSFFIIATLLTITVFIYSGLNSIIVMMGGLAFLTFISALVYKRMRVQ